MCIRTRGDSPEQDPVSENQPSNDADPHTDQVSTSENSPETSPQYQAGPSHKPDQGPGHLSRKDPRRTQVRRQSSVRRQRSTSFLPTEKPTKGSYTCVHPKKKKSKKHPPAHDNPAHDICDACGHENKAAQQDEGATQDEQDPIPVPEPHNQEETPQPLDQGAQPKTTTRSGRQTIRPNILAYQRDFTQHETREPTPKFRIPNAVAPKPSKPTSPTDL